MVARWHLCSVFGGSVSGNLISNAALGWGGSPAVVFDRGLKSTELSLVEGGHICERAAQAPIWFKCTKT